MSVTNDGSEPAGPFQMTLALDADANAIATADVATLAAGQSRETCLRVNLPGDGRHVLFAYADLARAVPELNERDNRAVQTLDRTPAGNVQPQPGAGPGIASTDPTTGTGPTTPPTPTPSPALADLTVSAIRVNGQVPDGKDDCKDGKNDVAVVVKNAGTGSAGAFVLRLAVDNGQGIDRSVAGLDSGKEQEVRFEDVRLKKGDRTLTATADAKETIAESNEGNNSLTVTARCTDDD
jgi:subtilase family serine protease